MENLKKLKLPGILAVVFILVTWLGENYMGTGRFAQFCFIFHMIPDALRYSGRNGAGLLLDLIYYVLFWLVLTLVFWILMRLYVLIFKRSA